MLRVHYSNQTEQLLDTLVESIRTYRIETGASLFEPTHLIVPNKNIETYVKLGLARLTGIAANIKVQFLRSLIDDLAEAAAGEGKSILTRASLNDRILAALLNEELLQDPELEPVREYLYAAGETRDAVDLRRFQLAHELSRLFDEYSISRPDLLETWKYEAAFHDEEYRKTEVWQRRLWLSLFDREPREQWTTPHDLLKSVDPQTLELPRQIHIFGVSYMARALLEILGHLSKRTEIHVYTLNPCIETWEQGVDLTPPKDGPHGEPISDDPLQLEATTTMPLLAHWGRPGRENLRLLNTLTGCELVSKVLDPKKRATKPTLLQQIQYDIAAQKPEHENSSQMFDFTKDESLVFLSCAGIHREIEIIAAEIWSLLRRDQAPLPRPDDTDPLRFNDIAVILPPSQAEAYQSLIGAVFGEMHQIPHNIVDLPIGGESRIAEAMELLLGLPLGKFTRQDLLRLATHPAVMARFPETHPDDWLHWCDALGIVHGADRRDHKGTYINKDVFNWDQGLKRLALGAFMSGERSGDARIFQDDSHQYLPEEVASDQMASAAQFGLLIRSLIDDARFAQKDRRPLEIWMYFITAMLTTYLIPQNEEDERVLRNALRRINDLADMKLGGKKVHYRIPYELVRSELAALSGSLGQYLVDGVVVSTFLPMRAIPFKVIFIAGLGESQFPSAEPKNLLDLRQARRRPGDVSPREQDHYMFLETLLSTRDKLYLSYVSRDELTGDDLEPSSVVLELQHTLERSYLPKDVLDQKIKERTYPLRRFDDDHTRQASPAAEMEHSVRELGRDLRHFLKTTGSTPDLRELKNKLPAPVWEQLAEAMGVVEVSQTDSTEDTEADTLTVSIAAIRNFLECPLQGSARFLLHMRDDEEEDILAREDEAFEASRLHKAIALRKVFLTALSSGEKLTDASLAAAYNVVQTRYELKGELPTGVFAESERQKHLAILDQWRVAFEELTKGTPSVPKVYRFGPSREHADVVDEVFGPVALEVELPTDSEPRKRRIEIVGTTQPLIEEPVGTLLPLTGKCRPTHVLRGFLDHVLLAAAGKPSGPTHSVCLLRADDKCECDRFDYNVFTQDEARDYLTTLLQDMLSGVHPYLLPCDAFIKINKTNGIELNEDKLPQDLDKLNESVEYTSSQYGPIKNPELCYEPPSLEEALGIINRRFGPFFDKRYRE